MLYKKQIIKQNMNSNALSDFHLRRKLKKEVPKNSLYNKRINNVVND